MPYRIVTKYGSVSDASFKLESRYVRVGTDGGNELVVLEKGLPPTIFILEATQERNLLRLHSRCSNLIFHNGQSLTEGQSVDWRVGETIIIGGLVSLELVHEPSRRGLDVSSRQVSSVPQQRQASNSAHLQTKDVKKNNSDESAPASKSASKSSRFTQVMQLCVTLLCCAFMPFLLKYSFGDRPSEVSQADLSDFSNEDALGFCKDDETMKALCTNGILNERRNPEAARRNFRVLETYARRTYEENMKATPSPGGLETTKQFKTTKETSDGTRQEVDKEASYREFFEYLSKKTKIPEEE